MTRGVRVRFASKKSVLFQGNPSLFTRVYKQRVSRLSCISREVVCKLRHELFYPTPSSMLQVRRRRSKVTADDWLDVRHRRALRCKLTSSVRCSPQPACLSSVLYSCASRRPSGPRTRARSGCRCVGAASSTPPHRAHRPAPAAPQVLDLSDGTTDASSRLHPGLQASGSSTESVPAFPEPPHAPPLPLGTSPIAMATPLDGNALLQMQQQHQQQQQQQQQAGIAARAQQQAEALHQQAHSLLLAQAHAQMQQHPGQPVDVKQLGHLASHLPLLLPSISPPSSLHHVLQPGGLQWRPDPAAGPSLRPLPPASLLQQPSSSLVVSTLPAAPADSLVGLAPPSSSSFSAIRRDWTQEEDAIILRYVQENGRGKWRALAAQLPGRSDDSVRAHTISPTNGPTPHLTTPHHHPAPLHPSLPHPSPHHPLLLLL